MAKMGAFKKRGLGHQWTTSTLDSNPKTGPSAADVQQSRQRDAEEQLRMLARQSPALASSVDRVRDAAPRLHPFETSEAEARRASPLLRGDPRGIVSSVHERGTRVRPPMATLPTLMHAEDPSYVDLYRNHLDDREARIAAKQQVAYVTHDRFVIDPHTKLRTQREERRRIIDSVRPPSADPAQHPEAFLPPSLRNAGMCRRRHTIEDGERVDTSEVARNAFCTELRKLCAGKPALDTDVARNPLTRQVLSPPPSTAVSEADHGFRRNDAPDGTRTVEMPEYGSPARQGKQPWASIDRSRAQPFQKQLAVRRHADELNVKRAMRATTDV